MSTAEVSIAHLRGTVQQVLGKLGYDRHEVTKLTDVLMYAQLRGSTQGIAKLVGRGFAKPSNCHNPITTFETPNSIQVNANKTNAMLVTYDTMEKVVQKAQATGFAVGGINNTNTSSGALSYYVRQGAEKGLVTMAFAQSPELVCPAGSTEGLFGTNPLALAFPTLPNSPPFVLDMATAGITFYGLVEAAASGKAIPPGLAFDKNGKPTTNASEAMDGSVKAFEQGHKGANLALLVELLAGPLVGAAIPPNKDRGDSWGHFLLAFNPQLLTGPTQLMGMKRHVQALLEAVKNVRAVDGGKVYTPGEKGDEEYEKNMSRGTIAVDNGLLNALNEHLNQKSKL